MVADNVGVANPYVQDSAFWDAALEQYHWDRLEAAYAQILDWGIGEAGAFLGWYRVIEAETISQRKSRRIKVNKWLSIEYVPEEYPSDPEELVQRVLRPCEEVARRLGWDHSEPTLVAILAEESDAPWATHPFGYCVHKEPYEKICLPNYLLDDPEEFSQAVAHEYAHVISEALTDGYAPRWLEEALSVLVESRFDQDTWVRFRDGVAPWLSPSDLDLELEGRSDDDGAKEEVWLAYQQAGWIGRYLASLGEQPRLAGLLQKIADESPTWNVMRTFRSQDRVEAALVEVYGLNVRDLFSRSLAYLRAQDGV